MTRPKILTPEEVKLRKKAANASYRIRKGQAVGRIGRPPANEERTSEVIGGIRVVKTAPRIKAISFSLPEDPTAEDMERFLIGAVNDIMQYEAPAAKAAATQILLKTLERRDKLMPPPAPKIIPRPRVAIEVEIQKIKCPHCGKIMEL